MTVTAYLGTVAAICTTGAFIPQIVKLRKQGGKDLSYQMLFVYLTGSAAVADLRHSDPCSRGDLGECPVGGDGADLYYSEGESAGESTEAGVAAARFAGFDGIGIAKTSHCR